MVKNPSRRPLAGLLLLVFFLVGATGCDLIFEPPQDAINRMLEAAITNDTREVEEMADNDEVAEQVKRLGVSFRAPAYRNLSNYWRFKDIREDEGADRTYLTLVVDVPRAQSSRRGSRSRRPRKPMEMEVVFEMQRRNLKWYVISIENMDKLLRKVTRL